MHFDTFFSDALAAVLGGMLLAVLFFVMKEIVFPLPRMSGRWVFETTTSSTSYKPYNAMKLRFIAFIWQEGALLHGTFEKVHESSSTGDRDYVGENRSTGRIEGHVAKFYTRSDKVFIHLAEEGQKRNSSTIFDLTIKGDSSLAGTFWSSVSEQFGTAEWRRDVDNLPNGQ